MKYFAGTRSRLEQSDTHLDLTLSSVVQRDDKPIPGMINVKIIEICNIFHKYHSAQSMVSMRTAFPKPSVITFP